MSRKCGHERLSYALLLNVFFMSVPYMKYKPQAGISLFILTPTVDLTDNYSRSFSKADFKVTTDRWLKHTSTEPHTHTQRER